jgi:hypothetical protein
MRSSEFWTFFETTAQPRLALRAETFAKMFAYLDRLDRPVGIVETGCVRKPDITAGDGASTILFDKYAESHPGSVVYSVDIDPEATALARSLVSARVRIETGDSVAFLRRLAEAPPSDLAFLDLLYLDSLDCEWDNVVPSAVHHLKELAAIGPLLAADTLVVVDDSPSSVVGIVIDNKFRQVAPSAIGGKGKYVAEYAKQVGAELAFQSYQCGWTRLRGPLRTSS